MPSPEIQTLMTAIILAGGAGIFLRLVGSEKCRREQWLQGMLDEKKKELKKAQAAKSENVEIVDEV